MYLKLSLNMNFNDKYLHLPQLVKEFFVLSYELDVSLSLWKYYKTPQFKRLMWVFDQMTEKIMKRVDNAVARLEALEKTGGGVNTSDRSVLEKLLLIDRRIAIVMAFDMLLAGIDTVRVHFDRLPEIVVMIPFSQKCRRHRRW